MLLRGGKAAHANKSAPISTRKVITPTPRPSPQNLPNDEFVKQRAQEVERMKSHNEKEKNQAGYTPPTKSTLTMKQMPEPIKVRMQGGIDTTRDGRKSREWIYGTDRERECMVQSKYTPAKSNKPLVEPVLLLTPILGIDGMEEHRVNTTSAIVDAATHIVVTNTQKERGEKDLRLRKEDTSNGGEVMQVEGEEVVAIRRKEDQAVAVVDKTRQGESNGEEVIEVVGDIEDGEDIEGREKENQTVAEVVITRHGGKSGDDVEGRKKENPAVAVVEFEVTRHSTTNREEVEDGQVVDIVDETRHGDRNDNHEKGRERNDNHEKGEEFGRPDVTHSPTVEKAAEELEKLMNIGCIIEHHLHFAESCVINSIYPLGLKTFVPCVAFKANDDLKKKWKKVLNNTSLELLALCKSHFEALATQNSTQIEQIEQIGDAFTSEKCRTEWEKKTKQIRDVIKGREKEMKIAREKKLKHAIKVHKEGRIFVENCLLEKGKMQNSVVIQNKGYGLIDSGRSKSNEGTSCGGNKAIEPNKNSGTPNEAGDNFGEVDGVMNKMGVSTVEACRESGISGKQNISRGMEELQNVEKGKQNRGEVEYTRKAGNAGKAGTAGKVDSAGKTVSDSRWKNRRTWIPYGRHNGWFITGGWHRANRWFKRDDRNNNFSSWDDAKGRDWNDGRGGRSWNDRDWNDGRGGWADRRKILVDGGGRENNVGPPGSFWRGDRRVAHQYVSWTQHWRDHHF